MNENELKHELDRINNDGYNFDDFYVLDEDFQDFLEQELLDSYILTESGGM